MGFVHGKNAQFLLRDISNTWRDMTSFLNEVTLPGKAGIAETTVFGRGAKTYIGGLLEGQLTMKGFFDAQSNGPDQVLTGLLGGQPTTGLSVVAQVTTASNYGQFVFFPGGATIDANHIAAFGDIVFTDYSETAPVTGVVSFTATAQLSGAPPATTSRSALNGGTTTGAYGNQVIRAPLNSFFTTAFGPSGSGGVTTYAALVGSTA